MNSVIKGASYVLVHTPDMVLYNGTTQTTERVVNPDSEYLKAVPEHLRSYEEAVSYWPNHTYIGNAHPDELAEIEFPYYDKKKEGAERYGKYGEIIMGGAFTGISRKGTGRKLAGGILYLGLLRRHGQLAGRLDQQVQHLRIYPRQGRCGGDAHPHRHDEQGFAWGARRQ